MNIDAIRKYCLGFPRATEKLQWDDALCFKVCGKLFAVAGLDNPRLTFKCTSEKFADLIEREDIRPSPYLGRHKWVMLARLDVLPDSEIRDLLRESYDMVERSAPKTERKPQRKKIRTSARARSETSSKRR